jgi:hypothetical protein
MSRVMMLCRQRQFIFSNEQHFELHIHGSTSAVNDETRASSLSSHSLSRSSMSRPALCFDCWLSSFICPACPLLTCFAVIFPLYSFEIVKPTDMDLMFTNIDFMFAGIVNISKMNPV